VSPKGAVTEAVRLPIPRHQLLAAELLEQIADGRIGVGERLPTEWQLCAAHGLARGTVRRALDRLEQLGMIDRRPGTGTTVLAARPVDAYQPVAQSVDDIVTLAATTRLVQPEILDVVLDGPLSRRIGARAGSRWHTIRGRRVRRSDRRNPVCWSEHYLRGDRPADNLVAPFTAGDLAGYRVEQTISADLLDEPTAAALNAVAGGPALVITRRTHDADGAILTVGIHTHPADRYRVTTVVGPPR